MSIPSHLKYTFHYKVCGRTVDGVKKRGDECRWRGLWAEGPYAGFTGTPAKNTHTENTAVRRGIAIITEPIKTSHCLITNSF